MDATAVDTLQNMHDRSQWRCDMFIHSANKCEEAFQHYYSIKQQALEAERRLNMVKPPETEEDLIHRLEKHYGGSPMNQDPAKVLADYATSQKLFADATEANRRAQEMLAEAKKGFDEAMAALIKAV
jgi:hypothetical protein